MIFNLFKSKPTLKELIPKGFIDIHSHILPGIDDGAKNLMESVELIKEMKKMGFSKIIGTPHTYPGVYNNNNNSIEKSFNKLNNELKNKNILRYASEYMIDSYLIEKASEKSLLTIKDNYVLIEMSFVSEPINLHEIIFEININGYTPILAHPERYTFLFDDFKKFYNLKKMGCYFQINLLSATGYYGKKIVEITQKLIKNNMIDFAGSDIHNLRHINEFDKTIQIKNWNELEKICLNNIKFN